MNEKMNEQTSTRMEWLDSAKAIGMVLVYIGHCNIPGLNMYIYLFHMPLFFIISGFVWNIEKNRNMDFKSFAKKKFKAYIIPYFKIATVCFILYGMCLNLFRLGWFTDEYWTQLCKYIWGIAVYSRGTVEWLPQCSPIWFLTCLFVAETIYYWVMRFRYPVIGVLIAGLLGFVFSGWIKLPWNIDNALSAIVLLYIGMLLRKYWHLMTVWKVIIPMFIVSVFILYTNETKVDFDGNHYSNMLAMYTKSTIISFALLTLISKWGGWKWLSLFGKETIVLFGYNYMLNVIAFTVCNDNNNLVPFVVIPLGAALVLFVRKYNQIKRIIV